MAGCLEGAGIICDVSQCISILWRDIAREEQCINTLTSEVAQSSGRLSS